MITRPICKPNDWIINYSVHVWRFLAQILAFFAHLLLYLKSSVTTLTTLLLEERFIYFSLYAYNSYIIQMLLFLWSALEYGARPWLKMSERTLMFRDVADIARCGDVNIRAINVSRTDWHKIWYNSWRF